MTLQEERENLSSQKDKLQSESSEAEAQLKAREDFLQEKETKLADEETRVDALSHQSENQTEQSQEQVAIIKKFNDTTRKLAKDDDIDVVVREGRPVLRVPNSIFFAFGETTLKPGGKALLTQLAQALHGQLDGFELRIETFTDSDGEVLSAADANADEAAKTPPDSTGKTASPKPPLEPPPDKVRYLTSWDLTGARAAAIARFLHDETNLPFQNVVTVARGDFQPIIAASKEGHARNRRVEITITPLPPTFHPPDLANGSPADNPPGTPPAPETAKSPADKSQGD